MAFTLRVKMLTACHFIALSLLLHCIGAQADFVNTAVDRKIDVSDVTETVTISLTMRNDGESPESAFLFAINQKDGTRVGDLFVVQGKVSRKKPKDKLPMTMEIDLSGETSVYKVQLQKPVSAGEEVTVAVHMDILSSLRPVPAEIKAKEQQFMKYSGNAYFFSPYPTETMKTTVTLGSSKVTSALEAPLPNSQKGSTLVLGPYTDVSAYSSSPFSVRFGNNRGFIVAKQALLNYHVSHWGRVAVREEFEIENRAAKLVGEWSRVDYDVNMGRVDPTSHGDMWANLPPDAANVEYKDLIGNITTSRLRKPSRTYRAFQLVFRFPLLGGWKNHFWYTYDILLGNHVKSNGESHVITLPVFPSLNYDLLCENLEVRVSLPEGATDVELVPHNTIDFAVQHDSKKTTLSFSGRPTVILSRRNIRSRSKHARDISIRYKFSRSKLLIAPAFVVTGIISFFLLALVFVRTEVVLVRDEEEEKRQKDIFEETEKLSKAYNSIAENYLVLQGLYNDVCRGVVDDVNTKRMTLSGSLVKQERVLASAEDRLRSLNAGCVAPVKELIELLKQKREYAMRFLSIENAFHSGDMQRSNYEAEMRRIVPVSQSLSLDVSNLFQSIVADH